MWIEYRSCAAIAFVFRLFVLGKTGSSKTLKTDDMVAVNDTSVENANDKRQLTALVSAAADGTMLPAQLVLEGTTQLNEAFLCHVHCTCIYWYLILAGKTAESLPQFPLLKWRETHSGVNDKQRRTANNPQASRCFVPAANVVIPGVESCCVTPNHWSDDVTSIGALEDIYVPYFKKTVPPDMFGIQICILIIDVWWGWYVCSASLRLLDGNDSYVPYAGYMSTSAAMSRTSIRGLSWSFALLPVLLYTSHATVVSFALSKLVCSICTRSVQPSQWWINSAVAFLLILSSSFLVQRK